MQTVTPEPLFVLVASLVQAAWLSAALCCAACAFLQVFTPLSDLHTALAQCSLLAGLDVVCQLWFSVNADPTSSLLWCCCVLCMASADGSAQRPQPANHLPLAARVICSSQLHAVHKRCVLVLADTQELHVVIGWCLVVCLSAAG